MNNQHEEHNNSTPAKSRPGPPKQSKQDAQKSDENKKRWSKSLIRRQIVFGLLITFFAVYLGIQIDHSYRYSEVVCTGQQRDLIRLSEGDPHTVSATFNIKKVAFSTDVWIEKDVRYKIVVSPVPQPLECGKPAPDPPQPALPWMDGKSIEASPDGFVDKEKAKSPIFWFRKYRQHDMFAVLGRSEPNGTKCQQIGSATEEFVADADGLLVLFVNDAKGFYANNEGFAKVTVTRLGRVQDDD